MLYAFKSDCIRRIHIAADMYVFCPFLYIHLGKTAGLFDQKLDLHLTYQGQERGVEGRLQLTNNLTYA